MVLYGKDCQHYGQKVQESIVEIWNDYTIKMPSSQKKP